MGCTKSHSKYFIIISGPPASGKTTLGKILANELGLPFLCRDDIKELLYDSLGWSDREWSKKLGYASYELLYYIMEVQLSAGYSFIVETNFDPVFANPRILMLKEKYHFETLQIHCEADSEILLERYKSRWKAGTRHPGHVDPQVDPQALKEHEECYHKNTYSILSIGGELISVNTNDLSKVDQTNLIEGVRTFIQKKFIR